MSGEPACWVVIPAAGAGRRMGSEIPKQYLPLAGRTIIEHTLACFTHHPAVRGIIIAIAADDEWWSALAIASTVPVVTVPGGAERADSVRNALDGLEEMANANDWVLVHDAARPCLSREDLDRLIAAVASDEVGGLLAAPVRDTMKRADAAGRVERTEDRTGLWHALTPQMFRLGLLGRALREALSAGAAVTDEASAVERLGLRPRLVEGSALNIKVTRPEDLPLAGFVLGCL